MTRHHGRIRLKMDLQRPTGPIRNSQVPRRWKFFEERASKLHLVVACVVYPLLGYCGFCSAAGLGVMH